MSANVVRSGKAAKVAAKAAGKKTLKKAVPAKAATAKRAVPGERAARAPKLTHAVQAIAPAEVSHRLHALLHTIHQIERYEERLCSMQDAIKRSGKLNAPLLRDLKALLEEIPSVEYQHDLDAVRDVVLA